MQNERTLIELGFQKNSFGQYFWRGENKIFTARVVDFNGPVEYVDLYLVSDEVDIRPNSDTKGRHYQRFLKSCCSNGSVGRALAKHNSA